MPRIPGGIYGEAVTIDSESEIPVYQQVAAILRARIKSGQIDRRMPSLKTAEQEMGVSHGSIERAYAMLRSECLIRPVIGRGFFVVPPAERSASESEA